MIIKVWKLVQLVCREASSKCAVATSAWLCHLDQLWASTSYSVTGWSMLKHRSIDGTCLYIPGTQMTLVLFGKGLLLQGSTTKIEDKQVPGICMYTFIFPLYPYQLVHLNFFQQHHLRWPCNLVIPGIKAFMDRWLVVPPSFLDSDGAFCTKGDALVVADDDICHNHGSLDSWETSATYGYMIYRWIDESFSFFKVTTVSSHKKIPGSYKLWTRTSAEFLLGEICTVFFVCFFFQQGGPPPAPPQARFWLGSATFSACFCSG